jgi:hypothetical protein
VVDAIDQIENKDKASGALNADAPAE